jgi:Uma2 family endonuclease
MSSLRNIYVPHYTYEDYKQWEGRWELIHGIPYAMSPLPSLRHQRINKKIVNQLENNLSGCKDCEVMMPIDWKIDEDIIVQPDVSVICHLASGNYLRQAPVLIFEIFSPSTKEKDRTVKHELYEKAGVKYYVLVDPDLEKVFVYELIAGEYHLIKDHFNERFTFELAPCPVAFDFNTIW